jgi:hypothetical protein
MTELVIWTFTGTEKSGEKMPGGNDWCTGADLADLKVGHYRGCVCGGRWGGLARGAAEIFVDAGETVFDYAVHVVVADGEGEFMLSARERSGHELGEGAGGFDVIFAAGDGDEGAAEGGVDRAVADEIGGQAGSDLLAGFDSVIYFVGVALVKVAKLRGLVFLEHAALAAVGKEERTQGHAVLSNFRGHRNLHNLI